MAKCMMCGAKGALLKVTEAGLCCACELERLVYDEGGFHINKLFHCYLPNNFIFFLAIDDKHRQFALCVQSVSKPFRLYFFRYADLIDFEYSENKTISNVYNTMLLSLYLNSLRRPQVSFYLVNSPVQFGSKQYNQALRTLKEIQGLLHYIRHNGRQDAGQAFKPEALLPLPEEMVKLPVTAGQTEAE